MPQVLCTLPNASEAISGVKFSKHASGMLSEEVSDEVATGFAAIPGYEIVGAPKSPAGGEGDTGSSDKIDAKAAAAAEKADLLARAEAIQFQTKANWGVERLKTEVEAAEAAHAAAAGGEGDK